MLYTINFQTRTLNVLHISFVTCCLQKYIELLNFINIEGNISHAAVYELLFTNSTIKIVFISCFLYTVRCIILYYIDLTFKQ